MRVVTVKAHLYSADIQSISDLAAECFGKVLQANGLHDTLDFSFDGDGNEENAATFQTLLDSTFRKPTKRKARKDP